MLDWSVMSYCFPFCFFSPQLFFFLMTYPYPNFSLQKHFFRVCSFSPSPSVSIVNIFAYGFLLSECVFHSWFIALQGLLLVFSPMFFFTYILLILIMKRILGRNGSPQDQKRTQCNNNREINTSLRFIKVGGSKQFLGMPLWK